MQYRSPTGGFSSKQLIKKLPFLQGFSAIFVTTVFRVLLKEIGIVSFQQSCEGYVELICRATD
jgi:hypothetical protein